MTRPALAVSLLFTFATPFSQAAAQTSARCHDWIIRDKIRGGYLILDFGLPGKAVGGRQ